MIFIFTDKKQNGRERFLNVMGYKSYDQVPNYEAGVWPQTIALWASQGLDIEKVNWDWFSGDDYFGMDKRDFFPIDMGMKPSFEYQLIEKTDRYEIFIDQGGRTRKALIEGSINGSRMSMDQYLEFPVNNIEDFKKIKKRYIADIEARYPKGWDKDTSHYKDRTILLIFGRNCSTLGFYWLARDFMGTVGVSFGFYDQPKLMEEIMEFVADFTIEMSRPFLKATDVDYVMINEDLSMKTGPLLSPATYKKFIYPHMKRVVDFYKSNGVKYLFVDTDGNCEDLLPMFMELGVDGIWPLERVANMDPIQLRHEYGRDLLLFGGIDKMILAKGKKDIDAHLAELVPLIEEGGFIPTVDHTVPPDVSLENFVYYMKRKRDLLSGSL